MNSELEIAFECLGLCNLPSWHLYESSICDICKCFSFFIAENNFVKELNLIGYDRNLVIISISMNAIKLRQPIDLFDKPDLP